MPDRNDELRSHFFAYCTPERSSDVIIHLSKLGAEFGEPPPRELRLGRLGEARALQQRRERIRCGLEAMSLHLSEDLGRERGLCWPFICACVER